MSEEIITPAGFMAGLYDFSDGTWECELDFDDFKIVSRNVDKDEAIKTVDAVASAYFSD